MNIDPKEIQKLIDKEAIREAMLRYARGMDRHDTEMAVQAYHPDATDDHGPYIGEPAGVIAYANDLRERHLTAHHTYITNQTIDLDGDTAHVETYFLVGQQLKDGPVRMAGGRYVDRFERRDGRWAVANRVCLVEWNGELIKTQTAVDPDLYVRGTWDKTDPSYQRPLKASRPHRNITS